ncbi:substrate-binding domain-containing protein [Pleomorphomonas carboxyditropha]|uniref:Sugar ABC transporter substrate-binding protein n=1 Tax=Pleomorphomonas carboxyditropha TaxID=2023338 RepID=A0A2G9WV81_9HYPH|nr:substrate-binding domain-containing protein [Pleomorphomonas carboxyditropha]PIO98030.1 sugar ABC transporter substrate-binding protein [Pleomorphomonas carboxyditropha]
MKKLTVALLTASALLFTGAAFADELPGLTKKDSFRFVIVPKVVHPWFDLVNDGAKHAAAVIEAQTGAKVAIEYSAPQQADVVQQNQILESTIATHPDGIAIDLLDPSGNRAPLEEAIEQGIQVSVFDSVPPEGMELTAIGNDFCEQAEIASERLVKLLNEEGEVAIMMGVPSAPNHAIRADCHKKVFEKYPNIKLVATGIDNDDIETAQKQAAAIMQANPNLKGWVACDAAGPIGIAQAITEAGKAGQVTLVGLDNLPEMLQAIRDGIADSSSSTKPQMQGYWAVMTMWQKALGVETPKTIDTGIAVLTKDNIGE